MSIRLRAAARALAMLMAMVMGTALAADAPDPAIVKEEIGHLLQHIADSGCDFYRNGAWTKDSKVAEAHVRGKYDFLVRMGQIDTTQDFIDKAATKSSLSGQPYGIKCGAGAVTPSSVWLGEELARYRASRQSLR